MRLWSIHPKYLDSKGLIALWREALLAQKVLQGKTIGYKNHPQLERFKSSSNPTGAIATYLRMIVDEAISRSYNFDSSKITSNYYEGKINITSGQIKYEFNHLLNKLKKRNPLLYQKLRKLNNIKPFPIFNIIEGEIESWEIL